MVDSGRISEWESDKNSFQCLWWIVTFKLFYIVEGHPKGVSPATNNIGYSSNLVLLHLANGKSETFIENRTVRNSRLIFIAIS